MAGGEHAERLAVVRIDGDRLLEQRLRDHIVLPRHPPVMRQRPHHQIPGVHAVRRLAPGAKIFRGIELRLDRGDDRLGDLVLHREHVGEIAVVALRPDVAAGGDVVELRRDAHAVAALAHAALDHIADAEFLGDLLHVDGLALVDERRVARDHEEPAQLGQRGDDVLADAVGEILLLRIAAHVGEGKHRDGGPVGQRQAPGAPARGFHPPPDRRLCRFGSLDCGAHSPTKRRPLRAMVRISFWSSPLSPTALRAALMRLVRVEFRHDPAAPDRGDEIVLADDAVAVLAPGRPAGRTPAARRQSARTAAELAPVGVKRMIGKEKLHVVPQPDRERSQGIIKPVSRTNQGKGKALAALPRNVRASKGERAVVANLINKDFLT